MLSLLVQCLLKYEKNSMNVISAYAGSSRILKKKLGLTNGVEANRRLWKCMWKACLQIQLVVLEVLHSR